MKTQKRILGPAHWLALALTAHGFVLAARAQSPLPDSFNPGADDYVQSLAVQADGKIVVGGGYSGRRGSRGYIDRFNGDGTQDPSFMNPGADGPIVSLALQPDGKTLVGGNFTTLGGQRRNGIARLNADGSLDTRFNPGEEPYYNSPGRSLALQPDGKILVGGMFNTLGGQNCTNIGRLNADGTLDSNFNPGADGPVVTLALQSDGKILVGGGFNTLAGQNCTNIGRLNADGTLDPGFNAGADNWVNALAQQADGKILVGGSFGTLGGQSCANIGRLNADGTLESSFNPEADGPVVTLALQLDGKILVGGGFTALGGQSRKNVGRLNTDGTPDTGFNPGADSWVDAFALQADGKLVVGGEFTTLGGQNRNNIGRLNNTEPANQSLTFDGSTLTWMRGGTGPEVWRTTFEFSPDGSSWNNLGAGIRIPGGWQLSGLPMPSNGTFRARGYTGAGVGSSWFVETIISSLALIVDSSPASRTDNAGSTAGFSVYAIGNGLLSYQWRKDGTNLADGRNVSGTATTMLTLSNVFGVDAGGYSVAITSAAGSVTSAVATLTVIDPLITVQPVDQVGNPGDSVTFDVAAVGTAPLSYQWRREDVAQAGAIQSSLTLTNLQRSDAGSYDVVVSNSWGSATSTAALLSVNIVLPDTFNSRAGTDNGVLSLALKADGRVLVGGAFTTLNGHSRNAIAQFNADGTLDDTFNPGATNEPFSAEVYSLAVQADGRIIVGGAFAMLAGQSRVGIGRLNADGTLDTSFNPGAVGEFVHSLAVQADGKILVGGSFTALGGESRANIGRLNADGTLDTSFNPGAGGFLDHQVLSLALQADGKILLGGTFATLGGQNREGIGRLNADGTLDISFNPGVDSGWVSSLAVQADGKILVGGYFTALDGQSRSSIGRLNADGSLDTTFNPGVAVGSDAGWVSSLAVQADGKIVVGGGFSTLGGQSRTNIARLNPDGTLDPRFNPGTDSGVDSLAIQADGKILVGGWFSTLGGQGRRSIGRLKNTAPAMQSLSFDGSTLMWLRGGTSPEVWRTAFQYSPDGGISWADLGAGIRNGGGWQLTGLSMPTNTTFRARGYTGDGVGSSWFVETVLRPTLTISDALYSAQGQFGFTVAGPAGQILVVEASTDLVSWLPIRTNTFTGSLHFSDPQSRAFANRYYRARAR